MDELLNSSLCEPIGEIGPVFTSLDVPCEDPAPELLPPADLSGLADIEAAAQEQAKKVEESTKCIEKVDEVNAIIDQRIQDYLNHKLIHDKLLEYRENFAPIALYFEARAEETARVLDLFQPLLAELQNIEDRIPSLNDERRNLSSQLENIGLLTVGETVSLQDRIGEIGSQIDLFNVRKNEINELLAQRSDDLDIFDQEYYTQVLNYSNSDPSSIGVNRFDYYLGQLFNGYIGYADLSFFSTQIREYSSCLSILPDTEEFLSIQDLVERTFFDFKLRFPKLNFLPIQKEEYDKETGNRQLVNSQFPIRQNPLLERTSFFEDSSVFELSDFEATFSSRPTGKVYTEFYDLLEDPLNNFFTEEERGLTRELDLIDPRVKGTDAQVKKEKNATLYVKDLDAVQSFYSTADSKLETRFEERRKSVIASAQEAIRINASKIARKEVRVILALNKVNRFLATDSVELSTTIATLNQQNGEIVQAYADLNSEIDRLRAKMEELKPDPDKIRSLLKSYSPECFDRVDEEPEECSGVKQFLGTDPLCLNTIKNGSDPTLPTITQLCYWKEFAKIASLQGVFPIPNQPQVTKLRYWPVGLIIPTPNGITKIPLPISWIPLVVIPSPLGIIVIFLTVNGVFISPVVFFVSSTGFKQHIITVRGSSEKFGYGVDDETIKPAVSLPLTFLSATSRTNRLALENQLGKNYDLTPEQREDLDRQRTILTRTESAADQDNNENRKSKVSRERRNFDEATEGQTSIEKFERLVNRVDEAGDAIAKAKAAIFNRINELGSPPTQAIDSIKEKIFSRREKLLASLKKNLELGNLEEVKRIRQELESDGVEFSQKIEAIRKDLRAYYDRLNFPKIVIPNDAATIDPKLNAITEFLDFIQEYVSCARTQFFTPRDVNARSLFSIQLAKSKDTIFQNSPDLVESDGKIDVDRSPDKVREFLVRANKKITDLLSGSDETVFQVDSEEIKDLEQRIASETDPVKKKLLETELEEKSKMQQAHLSQEAQRLRLALTPAVVASLSQVSVDFDPFAPCCQKSPFTLPLGESPALPILASVKSTLDEKANSLTSQQIKSLAGGRSRLSPNDLALIHLNLIKSSVPRELNIPLPGLDVASLVASFSGVLVSLFEIKAPIKSAQPALPKSVTIDLNILKQPLLSLLLGFLANCLPDPPSSEQTSSNPDQNSTLAQQGGAIPTQSLEASRPKIDPKLEIITCEPDESQDSILRGGSKEGFDRSRSNLDVSSLGATIIRSNKDVLPSFQTLDRDFLSVNAGDLLAVLKNFVDLQFSKVESVVSPFYSLLRTVRGLDGENLNIIEAAQYAAPPYGPPTEAAFLAVSNLKKTLPRATNFKIIDPDSVEQRLPTVETSLAPITNSPVPGIAIATAGAIDYALPKIKLPQVDPQTGEVKTVDRKPTTSSIRLLHPIISQDDLPPWERLSPANPLFLLFVDEFVATGADQIGFFRAYA